MADNTIKVLPFPWIPDASTQEQEKRCFKWYEGDKTYQVYLPTLKSYDLDVLVPHCLNARCDIKKQVAEEEHLGSSLFKVFPKSLGYELTAQWELISQQVTEGITEEYTEENFDECIKQLIAGHSRPDDRHDLVIQLTQPRKPRNMTVQHFWYTYQEYCSYVDWLPGNDPTPNPLQQGQYLYDAMPQAWKEEFIKQGRSRMAMSLPEILYFFRSQERLANMRIRQNQLAQKSNKRKRRFESIKDGGSGKKRDNADHSHKKKKHAKHPSKNGDSKKDPSSTRISDDTPCPVHPGKSHSWGECVLNAKNPNRKLKFSKNKDAKPHKGKKPNNAGDNHAIEEIDHESDADDTSSSSDCEYYYHEFDDASNCFHVETIVDESCFAVETLVDIDAFLTSDLYHLDNSSTQRTNCTIDCDAFYACLEECFATGDNYETEDINVNNDFSKNVSTTVTKSADSLRVKPLAIMTVTTIQGHANKTPLKVLIDSGSDRSYINPRCVPKGAHGKRVECAANTLFSKGKATRAVTLDGAMLPEFSPTRRLQCPIEALVAGQPESAYDLILGLDDMIALGIDVKTTTLTVEWGGLRVPFQPVSYFQHDVLGSAVEAAARNLTNSDDVDSYTTQLGTREILESKYDEVDTDAVAAQQTHLTPLQRRLLAKELKQFTKLFSGKLGCYPHTKVHLELTPDAKPFSTRPYPVPRAHRDVFKEELDRLVELGVLSPTGPAEYLSATFIIPKKDNRVRWVSDFRKLNSIIKRKVHTLPRIQDILKKRSGYKFFSKLDISMQYYTFELDEASKDLCTICTEFGNFKYNRLPMGVKQSPDIAQNIMEQLFAALDEVDVYIDDIGVFSNSFEDHLQSLHKVLTILQDNNFTVNPLKCEWAVQETDWLGYWLTPTGLKPWKKKIQAILALQAPSTIKELRSFIGAVTFYRDMFPRRSHLLAPLTAQVGKRNLKWTPECDQAFKTIKAVLAKEAFIRYPDHNKPFHIYTDASDYQLGSVIMQEGKPVAYFSRKLNAAQRNYTVGEKEILSIVETLREYKTMLYGCCELHVYTDHKNLTFSRLQTQRVLRWRLFLEEFNPIFHYIKGEENTFADALSRLPYSERQNPPQHGNPSATQTADTPAESWRRKNQTNNDSTNSSVDNPLDAFFTIADDDDLTDCFVHLPAQQQVPFNMDYNTIAAAQAQDAELLQRAQRDPNRFARQLLAPNTEVYCYIPSPGAPWKIYLPASLLTDTIRWYHLALGHLGANRLLDTLKMHFYNPRLQATLDNIVSKCDPCQRLKNVGRGHGETATREATLLPWHDVAVDCIGPWTIKIGDEEQVKFSALTIIDMVTNLVEIVRLDDGSAANAALHFENTWLARYPRPMNCIFDQGTEFKGWHFQQMLHRNGIHGRPITVKNPQANSVCERMHQSVGNSLRVLTTLNPPAGITQATQLVDTAISQAMYATRCAYSSAIKTTPGGLAFGRDMLLNIPLHTDLEQLRAHRQQLIDNRLIIANRKRYSYDYRIGDEVLKLVYKPDKLDPRAEGPYRVVQVHANGTLTIQLSPTVVERISLRRVKPYRR